MKRGETFKSVAGSRGLHLHMQGGTERSDALKTGLRKN